MNSKAVDIRPVVDRYDSPAYTFITTPPGASEWGNRLGDERFRALAGVVGDLSGKTVLEIGAGTCYVAQRIINELRARHVMLCDPAITDDQPSPAIEMIKAYFDPTIFRGRAIDLVVSINNLEHIPDPFQHLADIRTLLEAAGGRLFVVIPECSRGLQGGDWGICVHEHLSYFTAASFVATVEEAGFAILWMKTEEEALLALLEPGRPTRSHRPHEMSEHDLAAIGTRFHDNLAHVRQRLQALTQRQGSRVAIHGCSIGLNNVLALLGLRSDPAIVLFDGDSAKRGKFLPAFDQPIRHAGDACYRSMTDLMVAATTYYQEIRSFATATHGVDPGRIEPMIPLT